jgi:hypothetical protein
MCEVEASAGFEAILDEEISCKSAAGRRGATCPRRLGGHNEILQLRERWCALEDSNLWPSDS